MSFPIRSPRDPVGGIFVFGRILDKIRLHAQGKLPEGYKVGVIAGKHGVGSLGVESVQGVAELAEGALESLDAQRSAGGVVGGLAHLSEAEGGTAQWCEVEAIAREALAI